MKQLYALYIFLCPFVLLTQPRIVDENCSKKFTGAVVQHGFLSSLKNPYVKAKFLETHPTDCIFGVP